MRVSEKQNVCLIAAHAQTVFSVVIDVFTENDALKQRQLNAAEMLCERFCQSAVIDRVIYVTHALQIRHGALGLYVVRFNLHTSIYTEVHRTPMKLLNETPSVRVLKVPR